MVNLPPPWAPGWGWGRTQGGALSQGLPPLAAFLGYSSPQSSPAPPTPVYLHSCPSVVAHNVLPGIPALGRSHFTLPLGILMSLVLANEIVADMMEGEVRWALAY